MEKFFDPLGFITKRVDCKLFSWQSKFSSQCVPYTLLLKLRPIKNFRLFSTLCSLRIWTLSVPSLRPFCHLCSEIIYKQIFGAKLRSKNNLQIKLETTTPLHKKIINVRTSSNNKKPNFRGVQQFATLLYDHRCFKS
jgi:hypothetical protein